MNTFIESPDWILQNVIDTYKSFIWTERYSEYGDFEIEVPATEEFLKIFKKGYYITSVETKKVMIIEKIEIDTSVEDGNELIISGRSLESILDRRIVWNHTVLTGNLQAGIKKLLDENIISPVIAERKIENFIFEESTDHEITKLTIDAQYHGDNIYAIVQSLCEDNKLGFSVTRSKDNKFIFKLYRGTDRSYAQDKLPYIEFSPSFDNLMESNYIESDEDYKNVTLVGGEGQGSERKTIQYTNLLSMPSGLERKEIFTDASGVSSQSQGGTVSHEDYNKQLQQKGKEDLERHKVSKAFEGDIETSLQYIYRDDFLVGDIVQIVNEYGIDARVRMNEIVYSQDEEGEKIYPTFTAIDDKYEK